MLNNSQSSIYQFNYKIKTKLIKTITIEIPIPNLINTCGKKLSSIYYQDITLHGSSIIKKCFRFILNIYFATSSFPLSVFYAFLSFLLSTVFVFPYLLCPFLSSSEHLNVLVPSAPSQQQPHLMHLCF